MINEELLDESLAKWGRALRKATGTKSIKGAIAAGVAGVALGAGAGAALAGSSFTPPVGAAIGAVGSSYTLYANTRDEYKRLREELDTLSDEDLATLFMSFNDGLKEITQAFGAEELEEGFAKKIKRAVQYATGELNKRHANIETKMNARHLDAHRKQRLADKLWHHGSPGASSGDADLDGKHPAKKAFYRQLQRGADATNRIASSRPGATPYFGRSTYMTGKRQKGRIAVSDYIKEEDMAEETETNQIQDLINSALNNEPAVVQDHFNSVFQDYVADAIAQRKADLAASMFNDDPEDEDEEYEVEDDDEVDVDDDETLPDVDAELPDEVTEGEVVKLSDKRKEKKIDKNHSDRKRFLGALTGSNNTYAKDK